jgi:microcystin-dependent protein
LYQILQQQQLQQQLKLFKINNMSNCSNCYNGCTEIVSDRCVKYTGINVPILGIQTGDSLSYVEQALITFLTSTLDGTGVKINLGTTVVCDLVQQYLPTCTDLSIVDISKALIEAACDLQSQVNAIDVTLTTLNADYTIECLDGVTSSSDTHAIVQAVINKLCQVEVDLVALTLDVTTNYVRLDELNALIQAYLDSQGTTTKYYNRMIPYAVVEYYGPLAGNFDSTGAGIPTGPWEKIYLCNGENNTPDKRGRVGVGTTDGSMLGLTLPTETNPGSSPFNPTYTLGGSGATSNQTVLTVTQIPAHTHLGTIASGGEHTHNTQYGLGGAGTLYAETPYISDVLGGVAGLTTSSGIHTHTISIASTGGNQAHSNVQVGLGCYYIQYRP